MLGLFTLAVILIVGYAYWREGLFAGFCMVVCVLISGVVAFNFWEPLADILEPYLRRTFLQGFEDAICLVGLFAVTLAVLRVIVDNLMENQVDYTPIAQQFGGAFFGLIAGYLLSGFLICMLETLPWHEGFLGFEPRHKDESPYRRVYPPDRVWLAMMRHAGTFPFANEPRQQSAATSTYDRYRTFDRTATFELRYLRHRRHDDKGKVQPYRGEFEDELREGR